MNLKSLPGLATRKCRDDLIRPLSSVVSSLRGHIPPELVLRLGKMPDAGQSGRRLGRRNPLLPESGLQRAGASTRPLPSAPGTGILYREEHSRPVDVPPARHRPGRGCATFHRSTAPAVSGLILRSRMPRRSGARHPACRKEMQAGNVRTMWRFHTAHLPDGPDSGTRMVQPGADHGHAFPDRPLSISGKRRHAAGIAAFACSGRFGGTTTRVEGRSGERVSGAMEAPESSPTGRSRFAKARSGSYLWEENRCAACHRLTGLRLEENEPA